MIPKSRTAVIIVSWFSPWRSEEVCRQQMQGEVQAKCSSTKSYIFLPAEAVFTDVCLVGSGAQEKPLLVWGGHCRGPSEYPLHLTEENEIEMGIWKTGNLSDLGTFPGFKIH